MMTVIMKLGDSENSMKSVYMINVWILILIFKVTVAEHEKISELYLNERSHDVKYDKNQICVRIVQIHCKAQSQKFHIPRTLKSILCC